jgi:hypothetical protein
MVVDRADTSPGSPYLGLSSPNSKKRARSFLRTTIALDGAKIDVAFPNSVMETRERSQLACGYP